MAPATSATTSDFATRLESASIGFDAASSGLAANGGGGVQAERAGEDSETMQDHAFGLGKQAIAPIERRPQRLMPRQRCPPTARQQVEEIVETNSQFLDAERGGPRRRQEAMAAVAERSHSDILPDPPLAPDPVFVTMPGGRESWTGHAKASEIRADSIVELTPNLPVLCRNVWRTNRWVPGSQCFSNGRIITNATRPVIAQKVHSGTSPNVD
jgi:hypothetical protein